MSAPEPVVKLFAGFPPHNEIKQRLLRRMERLFKKHATRLAWQDTEDTTSVQARHVVLLIQLVSLSRVPGIKQYCFDSATMRRALLDDERFMQVILFSSTCLISVLLFREAVVSSWQFADASYAR